MSVPIDESNDWDDTYDIVDGVLFVPNRMIVEASAVEDALDLLSGSADVVGTSGRWAEIRGEFDAPNAARLLRMQGIRAQLDHVFWTHSADCCCCCHDHPADLLSAPLRSHPLRSHPLRSHPLRSHPLRSHPLRSHPLRSHPLRSHPLRSHPYMSSARPAPSSSAALTAGANGAHVVVLDTGLAGSDLAGKSFRPAALGAPSKLALISGDNDVPDAKNDGWLDEVAGHGTFIAGLIGQHAPGTRVEVFKLVNDEGLVDTTKLHTWLHAIATRPVAGANAKADVPTRPLLLNLSFGGYVDEVDYLVVEAITKCQGAGITVVASAGNEGWCEPIFPAAIPGVISVGSLGPKGPSVFSNYGPWVRCSAPGEDLVSTFFSGWNGSYPKVNGVDKDQFDGWAAWSGTSFSTPMVVAALIRKWLENGNDMKKAIYDLIDAPHLARIPSLGTVVNL